MRRPPYFLDALLDLPEQRDPEQRRRLFRQSMAALGMSAAVTGPGPLEGLHPERLARSVQAALADGLLDDLGWLEPAAAAVALYELAAALPHGGVRRDIARRALGHLYEGNAATFVAIATRMAAGSAKGLRDPAVRARVALALALPGRAEVDVGPLALALCSRRDLAVEWIGDPATGSLPSRRLAARLIERAALEAARRAAHGDDQALALFRAALDEGGGLARPPRGHTTFVTAWQTLLSDREGLVWRHVAVARGLLSGVLPEAAAATDALLSPDLSPTEWRRGATSLVAGLAVDPDGALSRALELLGGPLVRRDPGIAIAMMWGLTRAADTEPEAAERLLLQIAEAYPIGIAEGLAEIQGELGDACTKAKAICAAALQQSLAVPEPDDGLAALAHAILKDLGSGDETELRAAVRSALEAFAETGTREAIARAHHALAVAADSVAALEALEAGDGEGAQASMSRRASVGLLRDIDASLLESGALEALLLLGRRPSDESDDPLDELDDRLARWLLRAESSAPREPMAHATLHQRQLRALLHVVDGESAADPERRDRARARSVAIGRAMQARLLAERGSPLRRAIAATLARSLDALVRDAVADAADAALYAASTLGDPADLEVLAEASMHPDLTALLRAYARFARDVAGATEAAPRLAALRALVADVPLGASHRGDVLRATLSRLSRAIHAVHGARSLRALVSADPNETGAATALEEAIGALWQIAIGAAQRVGGELPDAPPASRASSHPLSLAIERVLELPEGTGAEEDLAAAARGLVARALEATPAAITRVVADLAAHVTSLPRERASAPSAAPAAEAPLPAWLPPRRTLGGFYVHRRLGHGALGTVFVVTRAEERHDVRAERFALKVPEYSSTAARSVSEAEFLKLFREEAGALLSVPEHTNLARFVTFDAGARPKPILVMELVEGASCERLVDSRTLGTDAALALLDGVLAGLESMHSAGVGHLDIKPSNVILRGGREPVLVDFGLAGRRIRPGCASGCYGAPEVWTAEPGKPSGSPLPADVYSFGCLAYEVLTGQVLFDAPGEVALVAAHLAHDGLPAPIRALAADPRLEPLAMFLFQCLRRDPQSRATVASLRSDLRVLAPRLRELRWPLAAREAAERAVTA